MSLPPLPLVNGALMIDNSFLESFTACPRKSEYSSLLKRVPSSDQPALNFGSGLHLALEQRYKTAKNESITKDQEEIICKQLNYYFAQNPQPDEDHRNANFAVELFKRYNTRYSVEPFKLLTKPDESVATELEFAVPLFEYHFPFGPPGHIVPVIYTGRIDLPVVWDDRVIIMDHKTTSALGDFYFEGQKVSPQYEGYVWVWNQIFPDNPASGYCINAIRTKSMPAKPTKGWDAWWEECFARHKEYIKPGQLEEWRNNTINHVEEFFWHYQRGYMPQRKKSCTMFGRCAYFDVCYQPMNQRGFHLQSDNFTDSTWSPLKNKNESETK